MWVDSNVYNRNWSGTFNGTGTWHSCCDFRKHLIFVCQIHKVIDFQVIVSKAQ